MTQIVASRHRHPKGLWIDWQHGHFAAVFGAIGLAATGLIGSLVTATVGAIVLIAGLRLINRPRI